MSGDLKCWGNLNPDGRFLCNDTSIFYSVSVTDIIHFYVCGHILQNNKISLKRQIHHVQIQLSKAQFS